MASDGGAYSVDEMGGPPSYKGELCMGANQDKWEFYKDANANWRWRRMAPNGKIAGASTEGYQNRSDCETNARRSGWPGKMAQRVGRVV